MPIEEAFKRTNEKLKAPRLKIPEITIKKTKGLFSFINILILEKKVVFMIDFFSIIIISFTKNIKIITAMAPGINEKRNTQ